MSKKAIVGLILLGVFLFLWFGVRPAIIYSICSRESWDKSREGWDNFVSGILKEQEEVKAETITKAMKELYQVYFNNCLNRYGINP